MAFKLCTIASGSSGNCTVIEAGDTHILVDVGISGKKVTMGLEERGINPDTLKGILITHEHSDHIQGVGVISRKYKLPIYATEKTWRYLETKSSLGKIDETLKRVISRDEAFWIDHLKIVPYKIYHDAIDPVGYVFEYENKKISLATDLGKVDDYILEHIKESHGILLEFNHDIHMLEVSGYPYVLKKRILSDYGHLCNEVAAKVLSTIYHKELKWAVLGHLSKENNLPDLAYLSAKNELEHSQITIGEDLEVYVAHRDKCSPLYEV